MCLFIVYQNALEKNQEISFQITDLYTPIFIGAVVVSAVLISLAHNYIPELLKKSDNSNTLAIQQLQFGLSVTASIFGLILFSLGGSFAQLVVLCLLAMLSLVRLYPQGESQI